MVLCARAHGLLLGRRLQQQHLIRRSIYSIDGVFDSHLREDPVIQVEKFWKPRLASSIHKVGKRERYGGWRERVHSVT